MTSTTSPQLSLERRLGRSLGESYCLKSCWSLNVGDADMFRVQPFTTFFKGTIWGLSDWIDLQMLFLLPFCLRSWMRVPTMSDYSFFHHSWTKGAWYLLLLSLSLYTRLMKLISLSKAQHKSSKTTRKHQSSWIWKDSYPAPSTPLCSTDNLKPPPGYPYCPHILLSPPFLLPSIHPQNETISTPPNKTLPDIKQPFQTTHKTKQEQNNPPPHIFASFSSLV